MNNKFEAIYNAKYINQFANHFADVPGYWLQEEFEDFNIIHDSGLETVKELLSREQIVSGKLKTWDINEEGGVYCILFPNAKSVYVGETFDLKRRFEQHHEALEDKKKYKGKMQNAYEKSKGKCTFVVLEHGRVEDLTKAEFKLYCMKRENYYKEVFHNAGYGLYNQEDTLNSFYRAIDILNKCFRWEFSSVRNRKRIHSMADLDEYYYSKTEEEKAVMLKHEQRRWELFSEALNKRFKLPMEFNK